MTDDWRKWVEENREALEELAQSDAPGSAVAKAALSAYDTES